MPTHAAIGPRTDLHILNSVVSPDGYPRLGVLAEGKFPGPLITGKKVGLPLSMCESVKRIIDNPLQGDQFEINVINELTNTTMLTSTSIVSTQTCLSPVCIG